MASLNEVNDWMDKHYALIDFLRVCGLIGAVLIGYWLVTSPHSVDRIQFDILYPTFQGLKEGTLCLHEAPCDQWIKNPAYNPLGNFSFFNKTKALADNESKQ